MTHAENIYQKELLVVVAEPTSLVAQLRVAVGILVVAGVSLFVRDNESSEQSDPVWVKLRENELEAETAYSNTPKDDPKRHEAHMQAQAAWRERDAYEAKNFDPS